MSSFKSKMLYYAMKYRHLFQGRLTPEVWDFNTSVQGFRDLAARTNKTLSKLPEGVTVESTDIDGMYAEWIRPANGMSEQVILYTVGGGYISGSCADHRPMIAKIVAGSGAPMLVFDHALAPENPYPAALNDAVKAYRWLLAKGYRPENILIVGESAGGGLCLAALLALRDQGDPMPAAAIAISPWTDLTLSGESYRTRREQCISPVDMAKVCTSYYAGEHDRTDPWISPLHGDLHGLPPLLIISGDWDTLISDSTRFAEKAKAAGVDVTLIVGAEMIHCYPLLAPMFPEATEGMNQICDFIRTHIGMAFQPAEKLAA